MLENERSSPRPSSAELHRWARAARGRAIALAIGRAARILTIWLRAFAKVADRLARDLLAAAYRRGAVRALQRLDDVALADIGVPRCEIEGTVQKGRPMHTIRKIEHRHQNWRHFPPQWQAALRQKLPQPRPPEMMESAP